MDIKVKIYKQDSSIKTPIYATKGSAGFDFQYFGNEELVIQPGQTILIPTGIHMEIPEGYELQIRPKSGLSLKTSLLIPNSPGTIDSDYRGEIQIIMRNTSTLVPCFIEPGSKIAQGVFNKVYIPTFEIVEKLEELDNTDRGQGGFGSTGK